jgi:hypothetical protein
LVGSTGDAYREIVCEWQITEILKNVVQAAMWQLSDVEIEGFTGFPTGCIALKFEGHVLAHGLSLERMRAQKTFSPFPMNL